MRLSDRIIDWLKEEVDISSAKGLVFGVSGGVDSAVVAVLAKKAFPVTVLGLVMPCQSRSSDMQHAKLLLETFDIPYKIIDLTPIYLELLKAFGRENDSDVRELALANLKPRLRMITLYHFANKLNYLVVGTGNKSELMMGYFTKYGDGGVDLLPLGDLLKHQITQLAKLLEIPKEIIDKPPSAGLWEGQTDEEDMGLTYREIDQSISAIEVGMVSGIKIEKLEKVKEAIGKSFHKRNPPPILKL